MKRGKSETDEFFQIRDDKGINEQIANLTSLGRAGLPDDIGNIVGVRLHGLGEMD